MHARTLYFYFRRLLPAPCLIAATAAAAELWVAPGGRDTHPGTAHQPMATLAGALHQAAALRESHPGVASEPLTVFLRDGIYPLTAPLRLSSVDSGSPSSPLRIAAAPGAHPVLSGGIPLSGWKKITSPVSGLPDAAQKWVWVAEAPRLGNRVLEFRQLWVNDRKAIRARAPNGDALARLVAWDRTNQLATVPAAALDGVRNPASLEMVIDQVWEIAVLRLKSLRIEGSNAVVTFKQPESALEFRHPWPPVLVTTNYKAPFYLANAIQFLDEPGEWFEDISAGNVYYWPRPGEDLTRATVRAPALETLVQIQGSLERPAAHIRFQGITFAHTTWMRPSEQGHVPLQAGMFLLDAKKLTPHGTSYHPGLDNLAWIGRPPAAVSVQNAHHITFEGCTFEHTASAGLDFISGTYADRVEGCTFRDLGGNGLQLGKFSDPGVETHLPYNPADERKICSQETIANNVIRDCGTEDWGCVGLAIGYARQVTVAHNEVFDLPYTGISVGWGWTKATNAMRDNRIHANHIHHVAQRLGDTAGIYTLSAQPGTVLCENFVHDIHISPNVPDTNHWFYLYLDEGSSGITVRDNACPSEKFLKNANGPGNLWTNNGPQVSAEIKAAAGLEPAFRGLLPDTHRGN